MAAPAPAGVRARILSNHAVHAALDADWAKAIDLNQKVLALAPDDLDARNRHGRALLETGKLDEAKAAFAEVLKQEPNNSIAIRNAARVAKLQEHKLKPNMTKSKTQPRLFIEDMGKTGILQLINPAPSHIVARYSPGAEAELRERAGLLAVHARDGELLGFLNPKVGRRLIDLLRTGNQYVVAIVSNDQVNPRIAIRETYQSAENANRVSFPGHHRTSDTKERAYIKGTFFRAGRGDEDDDAEPTDAIDETAGDDAELSEGKPRVARGARAKDDGEDDEAEE